MGTVKRCTSIGESRSTPLTDSTDRTVCSRSKGSCKDIRIRTILTLLLFVSTALVICMGHVYCALIILLMISKAYYELVNLYDRVIQHQKEGAGQDGVSKVAVAPGKYKKRVRIYVITKALDLLSFISLETYFLLTTMVGISFPWLLPRVSGIHPKVGLVCGFILSYHHLLIFLAFLCGIIKFILGLEKGRSRQQFLRFAFITMSLLYVVIQSMMVIANLYYGMIWLMLPHAMIVMNDMMAYVFGKWCGRTPLISLSPNKTLEGFVGAFVSTSLIIALITPLVLDFRPMICPVDKFDFTPFSWMNSTCEPASIYKTTAYVLPEWVAKFIGYKELLYKPCFVHIMILTLFASFFAPFGGFLASGFKRALKVKDFSDTIPGHGGMMDRFDCHILMGAFTYLYLKTFVRRLKYSPDAVLKVITRMTQEDRATLFEKLKEVFG